jgi:hypothetical protein
MDGFLVEGTVNNLREILQSLLSIGGELLFFAGELAVIGWLIVAVIVAVVSVIILTLRKSRRNQL